MDAPLRPWLLLVGWLLLNLAQAAFSPLDPDETYYWMYAGRLDWGYFDHPPAVALLIALGRDWLPASLGLRFGHVLAGTATVAALYHLLGRPRGRELTLAAALIFAQPFLHVYGFIATPDGPLLLFTVLYLLAFRRFLGAPSLGAGLLWGLTMAGLLYSKYHGVILIFFTVLPILPRLLRQPGAWVAALSGALLFLPHLYWQWANDFPSFRYHLSGRNDPYRLSFTVQYLLNQLLVFSPFLVYHYVRTLGLRWKTDLPRSCRWLVFGVLLFFLYSTSRGRTEGHWTALLCIPLVYLLYHAARERHPEWRAPLMRLAAVTTLLLLVARLLLIAPRDWLPFAKPFDHAPWVAELAERAAGKPVFFENSYRLASLYRFYSGGQPAWTFTDVEYRLNQYDLWTGDERYQGDTVLLAGQISYSTEDVEVFQAGDTELRLKVIPDFQVAAPVRIAIDGNPPREARPGSSFSITLRAASPFRLHLRSRPPLSLFAIWRGEDGRSRYWELPATLPEYLPARDTVRLFRGEITLPPGLPQGGTTLTFGLGYRGLPPLSGQSRSIDLTIRAQ
jgi:hypothetical protein